MGYTSHAVHAGKSNNQWINYNPPHPQFLVRAIDFPDPFRQGIQFSLSHLTSLPYQKPIGLSVHSVVNRLQQIDFRIDFSNEVLGLLDLRTQADQFALVF